jgi:hypothetical protein
VYRHPVTSLSSIFSWSRTKKTPCTHTLTPRAWSTHACSKLGLQLLELRSPGACLVHGALFDQSSYTCAAPTREHVQALRSRLWFIQSVLCMCLALVTSHFISTSSHSLAWAPLGAHLPLRSRCVCRRVVLLASLQMFLAPIIFFFRNTTSTHSHTDLTLPCPHDSPALVCAHDHGGMHNFTTRACKTLYGQQVTRVHTFVSSNKHLSFTTRYTTTCCHPQVTSLVCNTLTHNSPAPPQPVHHAGSTTRLARSTCEKRSTRRLHRSAEEQKRRYTSSCICVYVLGDCT